MPLGETESRYNNISKNYGGKYYDNGRNSSNQAKRPAKITHETEASSRVSAKDLKSTLIKDYSYSASRYFASSCYFNNSKVLTDLPMPSFL